MNKILKVLQVTAKRFHSELDTLPNSKRVYLDAKVKADRYYLVINEDIEIVGGFGTCYSGYLTGLFSKIRGLGDRIISLRLEQADTDLRTIGRTLTLFCIGDKVRDTYIDLGFNVGDAVKWDDIYAPEGWDYHSKGRPTLYNMYKKV